MARGAVYPPPSPRHSTPLRVGRLGAKSSSAYLSHCERADTRKPAATIAASLMHVPPSLPGKSCEPLISFQFRICSNPSIAVLLVVLTRSSGPILGSVKGGGSRSAQLKAMLPTCPGNDPTGATAISLRRRFFAPRFEATPSLRVAPPRNSLADEKPPCSSATLAEQLSQRLIGSIRRECPPHHCRW